MAPGGTMVSALTALTVCADQAAKLFSYEYSYPDVHAYSVALENRRTTSRDVGRTGLQCVYGTVGVQNPLLRWKCFDLW